MLEPEGLSPELKDLCERASREKDPVKLRELADRINSLLDEKFSSGKSRPGNAGEQGVA